MDYFVLKNLVAKIVLISKSIFKTYEWNLRSNISGDDLFARNNL